MQVMISIDEKEVENDVKDFCFMGRTGEVSFG